MDKHFSVSNCHPSQVLVVSVEPHRLPHHDQMVDGMENVQIGCSRQERQVFCHQICNLKENPHFCSVIKLKID
jgi:hypothetical protein